MEIEFMHIIFKAVNINSTSALIKIALFIRCVEMFQWVALGSRQRKCSKSKCDSWNVCTLTETSDPL